MNLPVLTVKSNSWSMVIPVGSIVVMNAMWLTDLEVAGMSEDQFRNELLYQTTMSIAKNLLKQEVISKKEYKLIDTIFTKKYNPSLGSLFADINLISI